jgi:hypothetical protein
MPRDFDRPALDDILPSLAQQVRSRKLGYPRAILYIFGSLMALVGIAVILRAIHIERTRNLDEYRESAVRAVKLGGTLVASVGAVYIVFAIFIKKFPVPITIMALVIYLTGTALGLLVSGDPEEALTGNVVVWLIRLVIITVLAKSVHWAISYERERRRALVSRRSPSPDGGREDRA